MGSCLITTHLEMKIQISRHKNNKNFQDPQCQTQIIKNQGFQTQNYLFQFPPNYNEKDLISNNMGEKTLVNNNNWGIRNKNFQNNFNRFNNPQYENLGKQ